MTVFIKDRIDFEECANEIAALFPERKIKEIETALSRFFWADERSRYWVYDDEQASAGIKEILRDFVAENQNESRISAQTAIDLQMPIAAGNATTDHLAGYWL